MLPVADTVSMEVKRRHSPTTRTVLLLHHSWATFNCITVVATSDWLKFVDGGDSMVEMPLLDISRLLRN